jgi:asparagine synthase (glutamine-hydrolysing)
MGFELYGLAAANGIRVVLSGQGADETIGGYEYLFDHMLVSEALRGRLPTVLQQARIVADARKKPLREVLARVARMARAHVLSGIPAYRAVAARRRLDSGPGRPYLNADFRALATPVNELPGQRLADALQRATRQSPLPHYLRAEDRNSMAHSVESRVPFLDHRLAEYAMRLPAHWQMSDGWNKRVQREAMRGRIPDSVRLRRQKFGFPTPAKEWFSGPLAEGMREIVRGGPAMRSGWFDQAELQRAVERQIRGEIDVHNVLVNLAQMDSWLAWHESNWAQSEPQSLTRSSA